MTSAMLTFIKDFFMLQAELPTVVPVKYGKTVIVDFYTMSWIHVQSNTCTYLHRKYSSGLAVSTCGRLLDQMVYSFNLLCLYSTAVYPIYNRCITSGLKLYTTIIIT